MRTQVVCQYDFDTLIQVIREAVDANSQLGIR